MCWQRYWKREGESETIKENNLVDNSEILDFLE